MAYVFPGQGSQHRGMGEGLFDAFKDLTLKADKILGYSIKELCLEDKENKLGQTQYTQPALYVVNALTYFKLIEDTGKYPDFVAGHSLGEFNALLAAGIFDFETGLEIVKYRAELMSTAVGGGMAAVIGLSLDKIKVVLKEGGFERIDIANINTPSQIVISGLKEDIERAKSVFEAAGAKNYVILKVSGAFHSRYMEDSKILFSEYIKQFHFNPPKIIVISNKTSRPYKTTEIKENMSDQITSSVMWNDSIRYIMGKGDVKITQVGPGTVVAGLVQSIKREAVPLIVEDEEYIDNKAKTDISGEQCDQNYPAEVENTSLLAAQFLGCDEFKKDYNLKYAYLAGGMYRGISSKEMIIKLARNGTMGFLGTGELSIDKIRDDIGYIQRNLASYEPYGVNLTYNYSNPDVEDKIVGVLLETGIKCIEVSAYMSLTPAIVRYKLEGLKKDNSGEIISTNRIIAKVSRPEIAEMFMSPVNEYMINKLLAEGKITAKEAEMAKEVPMADDICVEAGAGWYMDCGVSYSLMPVMLKLRDEIMKKYNYHKKIRVGAAGGIGTPEAVAAAFVLGADFILTGSINQCTVEAKISSQVKDMLQKMNVQDTEYVPSGDTFEIGGKVQVLKKGLFFPARATKLYELYRMYNSIEEINETTKRQIQDKYFKRSFNDVYRELKELLPEQEIKRSENDPKYKMKLIFKCYFKHAEDLAISGSEENRVDYQILCSSALGAFNQWVKGTDLEDWKNRHVDEIGIILMKEAAESLRKCFSKMVKTNECILRRDY
ncbi:trans-AT polyketide synthase/acyltransferase/oxidoreductase domain-containing protein [Ruminiclostridium sufflavum DSM 19573]|uniref:[acyl-carrier-protein] S-malonyltransferase n=1 Tax=Ruminiclostridium sufflavum DSM 19573 TaxID=1121337 RepID=A0A318XJR6_9FIRM|nr:trans-AT polyketide synthase/acyltransferase/oxidoreductase domain-containing protein [Ruminiclostridium sufflavum DSM 19573]